MNAHKAPAEGSIISPVGSPVMTGTACVLGHIACSLQGCCGEDADHVTTPSHGALQITHAALHLAGTLPSLPRGALPSLAVFDISNASLQGTLPQLFGNGSIEFIDLSNLGLSG